MTDPLYESDEVLWIEQQAKLLGEGALNEIDSTNLSVLLIEMGRRDLVAVKSHMELVISHLLKWKYQPVKRIFGSSWKRTIINNRSWLQNTFDSSKTLLNKAKEEYQKTYMKARNQAIRVTNIKTIANEVEFTFEQMMDDDFWWDS